MYFCKGCGIWLRRQSGKLVEVKGELFFKCNCGYLNPKKEVSKAPKEPHPKNMKPLVNSNGSKIYFHYQTI